MQALAQIKQQELIARKKIVSNPVQMDMIRKRLKEKAEAKAARKAAKATAKAARKAAKKAKKHEKARKDSSSDSESDESQEDRLACLSCRSFFNPCLIHVPSTKQ